MRILRALFVPVLLLSALALMPAAANAQAPYVWGYSRVSLTSTTAYSYSYTEIDYVSSYYYSVGTDAYLSDSLASNVATGYSGGLVTLSTSASIGNYYWVQTNHWVYANDYDPDGFYDIQPAYYAGSFSASPSGNAENAGSFWVGTTWDTAYYSNSPPSITSVDAVDYSGTVVIWGSSLADVSGNTSVAIDGNAVTTGYVSSDQLNANYFIGPGGHVVTVTTQYGSTTYNFYVSVAPQVITWGPLPNRLYGVAPFTISATATSGLPVYFWANSSVCTVSGNTVTLIGVGDCLIYAYQPGNANWLAAPTAYGAFIVTHGPVTITSYLINGQPGNNNLVAGSQGSLVINGQNMDNLYNVLFGNPAVESFGYAATPTQISGTYYISSNAPLGTTSLTVTTEYGTARVYPTIVAPLTVTTTSLSAATVGQSYTTTLAASGGVAPYTWSAASVPPGLSLSNTGTLTGTPTAPGYGTQTITGQVTDSGGQTQTVSLTLSVQHGTSLVVQRTSRPSPGTMDTAYANAVGLMYTYTLCDPIWGCYDPLNTTGSCYAVPSNTQPGATPATTGWPGLSMAMSATSTAFSVTYTATPAATLGSVLIDCDWWGIWVILPNTLQIGPPPPPVLTSIAATSGNWYTGATTSFTIRGQWLSAPGTLTVSGSGVTIQSFTAQQLPDGQDWTITGSLSIADSAPLTPFNIVYSVSAAGVTVIATLPNAFQPTHGPCWSLAINEITDDPQSLPIYNPATLQPATQGSFEAITTPPSCLVNWTATGPATVSQVSAFPTGSIATVLGNNSGSNNGTALITAGSGGLSQTVSVPIVQQQNFQMSAWIVADDNGNNAAVPASTVAADIANANLIWQQAGIQFTLAQSPQQINNSNLLNLASQVSESSLQRQFPADGTFHVYYTHGCQFNTRLLGDTDYTTAANGAHGIVICVADQAINNASSLTLMSTLAHELGHAQSLPDNTTNSIPLMAGSANGTLQADLSIAEANRVYTAAITETR